MVAYNWQGVSGFGVSVALQDSTGEVVEFYMQAVGGLLSYDAYIVSVDVVFAQFGCVGVPQPCEAAETEHITDVGKVVLAAEVEIVEFHKFVPFEVDNLFGVSVCAFEFGSETVWGGVFGVAVGDSPASEPAENGEGFCDGGVTQAEREQVVKETL